MSKANLLTLFFSLSLMTAYAQDYVEVAVGASYSNQAYYNLSTDDITTLANDSWDLAFTLGGGDFSILYNESSSASFTGPAPELRMYVTNAEDFSETIELASLTDSLYNDETSWANGAFNTTADPTNPFDLGWGLYDPSSHVVTGSRVYALKLRDNSWKKIKVESLQGGVFTVKHADLDGANEATFTVNKADYDSPMAFFSFTTGEVTASPADWDLVFQRYKSPLDAGGDIIEYPTTGVLTAAGIEVAKAVGVVPAEVEYEDYQEVLTADNNVIGHDWKAFDLENFQWVIAQDRAYFIKMQDDRVWKINFIDFEGSSTGLSVFQKTDLGVITALTDPQSNFTEASVFPNPVIDQFTIAFSLKTAHNNMPVQLINNLGQQVWNGQVDAAAGFNTISMNMPQLTTGMYQLVVGQGNDLWTTTVFVK